MRTKQLTISLALALGLAGCKNNQPAAPATIVDANNGVDPAAANLAPVDPNAVAQTNPTQTNLNQTNYPTQPSYSTPRTTTPSRVLGQRSEYPSPQPTSEQYPEQQPENDQAYDAYDQQVNAGQDALYADQAPPPLPVYDQPELTQANDQWTPGYWNYASTNGYYFVPGAWVAPPYAGALWTPGYWGYEGRRYRFHRGFWGRHIGFYGGINYGFGYTGRGYEGGYWNNNNFFYNNRVNRVNVEVVRNVYTRNVVVENNYRYSYNGPGGYNVRPVPAELAVYHEQRLPPQQVQLQIREQAATNRQQFFQENHGRPAVFAAPVRFNADAQPPRPIEPLPRNGFGQPGNFNQQQQLRNQQQQALQQNQQRNQQQQQAQQQQRLQQDQQRNQQQQQRTQQAEQRTAQQQQVNAQQQQQNAQRQQQEQQRTQQLQQRNAQQQQNAQQLQQRAQQQQGAQQQQRIQAEQQRNAQAQQQNAQRQQQVQAQQQRTQQAGQAQQQRAQQDQQRAQQEQQRGQQEQQRGQQEQQRGQQNQQREAPRPQVQAPPQPQPQRPVEAPRPQAPPPQAAPRAEPPHQGEHPHR